MAPDYELSPCGNFMAGMRDEAVLLARAPAHYLGRAVFCLEVQSENGGEAEEMAPAPLVDNIERTHYCACCVNDRARARFYYCGSGIVAGLVGTVLFSPIWGTGLWLGAYTTNVQAGGILASCGFACSSCGWIRCISGICNTCDNC